MKLWIAALVAASLSYAQQGAQVDVSEGPPSYPYSSRYFRDGSGNLEYECRARAVQPTFTWRRSTSTITDVVDSANTSTITFSSAHGLAVGNAITIAGATVDADLNGTYFVQTVGSTTTATITTASVTDATYTDATMTITTTAPRTSAPIWSILKLSYTVTDIDRRQWSDGSQICDNRATSTGATKVTYR